MITWQSGLFLSFGTVQPVSLCFFFFFFVFMEVVCWTVVSTEVRESCMRLKLHIVTQTLAKLITVYGSVKNGLLVISSWPVGTLNVKLVIF